MNSEDIFEWVKFLIPLGIAILFIIGGSMGFFAAVKKKPKLFKLINLPIILYPYAYLIILILSTVIKMTELAAIPLFILFIVIHPMIIASLIADFRIAKNKIVPAKSMATFNMVTKLVHIPAYIFHFILGVLGSLASVWGIGFVMFAIIIDLITIAATGTLSLSTIIGAYKQKVLSLPVAIICGIFSYIYCIDVIVVIILKIIVNNHTEKLAKTGIT